MDNNVLIFRSDRIGDLIVTCPVLFTIKKNLKNCNISIITSDKNYDYAKKLNIFDEVFMFPKKNLLNKIRFMYNLSKKKFDYIFIFDGKDRSLISSLFIKSNYKVALFPISKSSFFWRIFNIKIYADSYKTTLMNIFQNSINYCKINAKISNYDFLTKKVDNKFSTEISTNNFIQVHLDEKWFSNLYINTYTNINPTYDQFVNFISKLSRKNNVLITTGIVNFDLLNKLKQNFFIKKSEKIYFKKIINSEIYFVYMPSFEDLESLLRKTKLFIGCHGATMHAANSFGIPKIDIIEENKKEFYRRFTSYFDKYTPIYRNDFNQVEKSIFANIIN